MEIERYADAFLDRHRDVLTGSYARRWVSDPFHQWSRQWEYPFVAEHLQRAGRSESGSRVLDAGSGVTFFPYYLASISGSDRIDAIDSDNSFAEAFATLNSRQEVPVGFRPGDLRKLPVEDLAYDAIYCLSVLEHTREYERILREFRRVLKPDGLLIVSFDVSLDGNRNIPVHAARDLLHSIDSQFAPAAQEQPDLDAALANPDRVTTHVLGRENPALLPWRYPALLHQLHSLFRGRGFPAWPPELTVYCGTWRRRGHAATTA